MVDDYMLDKVLHKTKETEKFDNSKIVIDTNDKSLDAVTLKSVVMLMTCVIKNDGEFY